MNGSRCRHSETTRQTECGRSVVGALSPSEVNMKLLVKHDYRSNAASYRAGQIIEVPDEFGAWLQRDSESCFEEVKPRKRRMRKPPADKAIHEATEK